MCAWGTTGPDFSYATMLYEPYDAPALHTGFIARDGTFEEVANIRMLTMFDADIVSPIRGEVHLTLDSGEVLKVDFEPAQAHAAWGPGTAFNSVGTINSQGSGGYGVYAVYANTARGQHICRQDEVHLAAAEPGLSLCTPMQAAD